MPAPTKPVTARVSWLGLRVEVESDDGGLIGLVSRHFGPSAAPERDDTTPPLHYVARLRGDTPTLEGPHGRLSLDRRRAAWHAYHRLVDEIFGQVESHFLLHAAAVERDGEALVVSAPSTFGKSTLAAALIARGFRLLADDVAAVERRTGVVVPSARGVQLRPGARDLLPPHLIRGAEEARIARDGDGWIVDPRRWLGEPPPPARIRAVAVLRGADEGTGTRRMDRVEIAVREGCEAALAALGERDGIDSLIAGGEPGVASLRVTDPATLTVWLGRHRDDVVWLRKLPAGTPDFAAAPRVRPVGRFHAALELSQEMLNRHPGSRIASAFENAEGLLVAELAETLRGATCLALAPGRLDETVTMLVDAFDRAGPRLAPER